MARKSYSDAQKKKLVEEFNKLKTEGKSGQDAAKAVKVSYPTLLNWSSGGKKKPKKTATKKMGHRGPGRPPRVGGDHDQVPGAEARGLPTGAAGTRQADNQHLRQITSRPVLP
jgi:transposase